MAAVILVALGERPTGGYSIFIDRVTELQDGSIEVLVRSVAPGPTCGVTAALTQPVDIARVPRRDGSVSFRELAETHNC